VCSWCDYQAFIDAYRTLIELGKEEAEAIFTFESKYVFERECVVSE
jgi:hypothetical protein